MPDGIKPFGPAGRRKLDLRSLSFHGYTGTDTVEPDLRSLSFHGYTGTDTVEPG